MKQFLKLLPVLLLFQFSQLYAQKENPKANWGLNVAINPGVSLSEARFVLGADFQVERYISNGLALTASAGFTHFFGKQFLYDYTLPGSSQPFYINLSNDKNLIPIKLGAKAFINEQFYVAGAAGIGIDINGNSSFIYSGTVGAKLNEHIDLGLKYENYSDFYNTNQLALRLAYRIF